MNILDAMQDDKVFGEHFRRHPKSWFAWRAFFSALFGLKMNAAQKELFQRCTGRDKPPIKATNEAWLIIGRRGGKSFALALIAVFLASFRDYREYLGPGERGTIVVIAQDRKSARTILRYVMGLLRAVPMLKRTIEHAGRESVDLANRITIEIHTASFRTVRGYTVVAALCDELAFWRTEDDAANPDTEILQALRPAMATIPNAMLLCASSPYAQRGALYDAYRRYYGKDHRVLCWQADTRLMNPRVPQSYIDAEREKDPASAVAEYDAQFRLDIEAFISLQALEACVMSGVRELPYARGTHPVAFADPSGGSGGGDSFTLAIGHNADGKVIIDCIREVRPPLSPENVVDEFCGVLKSYGIRKVQGDHYAGQWPAEQFKKRGITYEPSEMPKSDLYRDCLPLINSRKVELLDSPRLIAQFANLERRTARSGKDSIDHVKGSHDDICNAVAGVMVLAAAKHHGMPKFSPELLAKVANPNYRGDPSFRAKFGRMKAFF